MIFLVTELESSRGNTLGIVIAGSMSEVATKLEVIMEIKVIPGTAQAIGYLKRVGADSLIIVTEAKELQVLPNALQIAEEYFFDDPVSYAIIRENFLTNTRKMKIPDEDAIAFFDVSSLETKKG